MHPTTRVLRVAILTLNYAPEPTGFAPHVTALAEQLAKDGHDVSVVTGFPFAPAWSRWEEYRGPFMRQETRHGVRVVRVTHFVPRQPGRAAQRILMEGTFAVAAAWPMMRRFPIRQRPDVIVYVGAQPALAWLARVFSSLWHRPYIVRISDIATQVATDVGILEPGLFSRLLRRVEFGSYRKASAAAVSWQAFGDALLAAGYPEHAIEVVPDSVDLAVANGNGLRFRARHGLDPEAFVVLYAGSLGRKQGLLEVVEAARLLSARCPELRWVLVGAGEMRGALAAAITAAGVAPVVHLLPLQPTSEMGDMYAAADVTLLSQSRGVRHSVIPSKLFMYMGAGRAVVAAVNAASQAAVLVREAGAGLVVDPEDAAGLAGAIVELRSDPARRRALGQAGRRHAARHFDRVTNLARLQAIVEGAAMRGSA